MFQLRWGLAVLLAAWAPLPLAAQGAPVMSASDSKPAQAQPYRSAFEEFKPFSETRDADWRAANERVRATGGHSGALAEEEADSAGTKAADPHAGHRQ